MKRLAAVASIRRKVGWALLTAFIAGPALAQADIVPSSAGYQPQGRDERGMWMEVEEAERELKASNFVVRDAALNAYVRGVLCRAVGERCRAARIYIVRTPYFNANMAPNGMMQVWTGLLLRARDEAQLAAVLGHEFAHFERRHQLAAFRDARAKTDRMAWLSFLPYGIGLAASVGQVGGYFANSRAMEKEADLDGLAGMRAAGYDARAAAAMWSQLRDEQDATAAERRRKSKKDKNGGFFATHPNSGERVAYLAAAAAEGGGETRAADYRAAIAPWWPALVDDQVKLNDFGATEYLLTALARDGWTPELLYARGELYRARGHAGDWAKAAEYYRAAIGGGSTLAEARRGLGLALLRMRQAEEGRTMLREYVAMKPEAGDRTMMLALAEGA
jgi:predicted Zn-dependent protease